MASNYSTPAKRRILSSPPTTPRTPKSPTGSTISVSGYLIACGVVCESRKKNTMFEIKLQCGENRYVNVKVMVMDPETDHARFDSKVGNGITLKKLSQTDTGTIFFNPQKGSVLEEKIFQLPYPRNNLPFKSLDTITCLSATLYNVQACLLWTAPQKELPSGYVLRKGKLKDAEGGEIPFTAWGDFSNVLVHATWYTMTDMKTNVFDQTLQLETSGCSVIEEMKSHDEFPDVDEPEVDGSEVLTDPNVIGANICEIRHCITCDAELPESNEDFIRCMQLNSSNKICNTKQIVSATPSILSCVLTILSETNERSVYDVDESILKDLFGEKVTSNDMENRFLSYHTPLSSTGIKVRHIEGKVITILTYNKTAIPTGVTGGGVIMDDLDTVQRGVNQGDAGQGGVTQEGVGQGLVQDETGMKID